MLRLAALAAVILPLGLDTFAVAASLGMSGLSSRERLRLSAMFAAFEGGMPLIGLLIGAALGRLIGGVADYLAVAALFGIGLYMLRSGDDDDDRLMMRFAGARGVALLGLGLSVSLDELAIGFSIGLLRAPLVPAVIAIALQAFIVSQAGFAVGSRVGERLRDNAVRVAGAVLIALAAVLLVARLAGLAF